VASYRLFINPTAVKELEVLPLRERQRLVARIRGLAANPRPPGSEKLSGQDKYRIRQGSYRVLYLIQDAEASVVVVKIGHRRDVYR
jgi:mRNA interferase RelE/StbE